VVAEPAPAPIGYPGHGSTLQYTNSLTRVDD
jgi:hypothetical protein